MQSDVFPLLATNPRETLVDRELSWLAFNERVLELAEDVSIPLLERARFLSIFSSNLDDFFMIRVATLKRKLESGVTKVNTAGYSPTQLMTELSKKTQELIDRQSKCFHESVYPALTSEKINLIKWEDLTPEERAVVDVTFKSKIFPVLTPLAVDPSHPFPYISGLSLNLAVVVKNPESETELFARIKVPSNLPRFIETAKGEERRFIPLEQVITAHIGDLFPGMEILYFYTFRVTRNADLELEEEESEDLLATMEQELLRRKFGPPVRLEVDRDIDQELLQTLMDELQVKEEDILRYPEPLDLTGLNQIADIDRPDLKYPAFRSQVAWDLRDVDPDSREEFFDAIRRREIMLHHPYESFTSSVVRFLESAAQDPKVLAIKQTLYRTSGDSPIVEALIEAAESGKQVLAVIEIRARFDEQANVRWARKLEDAGVHVVYGLVGHKTHAKLSLVVREEAGGIRRYVHIGTGNYNPKTARLYEDFGILSADPVVGEDVNKLFNQLSGFAPQTSFERLLVAPRTLRSGLLAKIQNEINNKKAGKPAGIRMKLNSIMDEEFIELMYQASIAGVKIELIVRGICALRPGVPGLSENITVVSVVGRNLEHSRIVYFNNGGAEEMYLSSADWLPRNLEKRIELMFPVREETARNRIRTILGAYFMDTAKAHRLGPNGRWKKIRPVDRDAPFSAQAFFYDAVKRRKALAEAPLEELEVRRRPT